MNIIKYTFLILLTIVCFSCEKEQGAQIEQAFLTYVNDFESEASRRGIDLDIDQMNITIEFANILASGILGQCLSYSDDSRVILIDEVYWMMLNEMNKEYLMFHELGHCVLDRQHLDDPDQNGNCTSIMQSGSGACIKRYNEINREQLLNELFDF